jgi:hypothetical protein
MIDRKKLIDWASTLHPESSIGIDDDGVALIEIDKKGDDTGAYLEVGGVPRVGPEDFPEGDDLCDKCMKSDVQVSRTDEAGNTICAECDAYGTAI